MTPADESTLLWVIETLTTRHHELIMQVHEQDNAIADLRQQIANIRRETRSLLIWCAIGVVLGSFLFGIIEGVFFR
jgi:hypothetical protein